MKFRKFWRGDTLIEVTLAVGIFSMVAIAVVAVVSGSTSSAQTALETTVTREEIDAQAEALRFIQTSYIAGGKTNAAGNELYAKLWKRIVSNANSNKDVNNVDFLTYEPSTCEELYDVDRDNNVAALKGFVLNTHKMYELNGKSGASEEQILNDIVVAATKENIYKSANLAPKSGSSFVPAATYPRILYDDEDEVDSVLGQGSGRNIKWVEGVFVVAVKDDEDKGTSVVTVNGGTTKVEYKAAYYDFYIRTCWFGPGADRPSTISTVIRLYDPDVIEY